MQILGKKRQITAAIAALVVLARAAGAQPAAYAKWAGGRVPTEAEREFAARGGLESAA